MVLRNSPNKRRIGSAALINFFASGAALIRVNFAMTLFQCGRKPLKNAMRGTCADLACCKLIRQWAVRMWVLMTLTATFPRVHTNLQNLRTCLHGGRANFSYVSLENASKRLHARQGSPHCRSTLSTCPGHPSRRAIFCHVNGSSRQAEVRRGERTALYFKAAFNVNCLWRLRSISRVQNNSPRH